MNPEQQAIGGVKGVNNYPYSYILSLASTPFELQLAHNASYYNTSALAEYSELPLWRASATPNTNSRDGIRRGDADQVPLQFYYEPADCRIYYTPEMAVDQSATWRTVADAAFRGLGAEVCVGGGVGGFGSDSGGVERRGAVAKKQAVRRSLDASEHRKAMYSVWTGKGGFTGDGDGFMFL